MCGIFGVTFQRQAHQCTVDQLLHALRALEYRGYDSAGLAIQFGSDPTPRVHKCAGRVQALCDLMTAVKQEHDQKQQVHAQTPAHSPQTPAHSPAQAQASTLHSGPLLLSSPLPPTGKGVGIAHTRWATHGEASDANAHPHTSADGHFALVHNGIITNHADLRAFLEQQGYVFQSDTDTEVIAMMCSYVAGEPEEQCEEEFDLARVVRKVTDRLEGAYALLVVSSRAPYELVATRRGSPLIVGLPKGGSTSGSEWLRTHRWPEKNIATSSLPPTSSTAPGVAPDAAPASGHSFPGSSSPSSSPAPSAAATTERSTNNNNNNNNYFFSSDAAALAPHVHRVLYLEDGTIAHVRSSGTLVLYEEDAKPVPVCTLDLRLEKICKHGYDDFMLKEIMEQPDSVRQTMAGRLTTGKPTSHRTVSSTTSARSSANIGNDDGPTVRLGGIAEKWHYIQKARRLLFFGCGTSYHAALVMQPVFERLANRPVHVELASDFLDRRPPVYRDDVCIFVSQSGETADTLGALCYCREEGDALCVGLVNTVGSNIARQTDCGLYLNCGMEVGVASTKAYTSQIVALAMLAIHFGTAQPSDRASEAADMCRALALLPEQVRETLHACRDASQAVAQQLQDEGCHSLLLIGRAQQYATCREGALKIKEIAYVHTEAVAAGELKHGSVALVDADAHMLVIATHDDTDGKVHNSLSQLLARNGRPFLVTDDASLLLGQARPEREREHEQCRHRIVVPRAAHPTLQCVLNVLPLQLIAYYLAKLRGYDVDRPRNLAKSVTVS